MKKSIAYLVSAALLMGAAGSPAMAKKKKKEVELTTCEQSLGTVAVVEGDTQGWTEYGLGSPRNLIATLATESGCFTPHNAASGQPADFLMNVIGGDSEEVDKSIEMAKSAAMEGLWRSGAATSVLSKVPIGGALLGAFGGLGGKKKRVAAGIKLLSPMNGQTIVVGQGVVKKTTLNLGGGNAWAAGVQQAGYGASKDGRMMAEAFILAFNEVTAQGQTIASIPKAAPAAAAAPASATPAASVAIDTILRAGPAEDAEEVRMLRAGTDLTPTGKREGLYIEVQDNYGTTGWVSVEDLG